MPQLLFQKQHLAWLVNRKWALAALFGADYSAQFALLDEEQLQLTALSLFHEAIAQGRFTHNVFIEQHLEQLIRERSFSEQVPYTDDFEQAFARECAQLDLLYIADYLYLLCLGYADHYPSFFQPEVDGYQYLLDVLVRAQYQQQVPTTPSLARAQGWLQDQLRLPARPAAPGGGSRPTPRDRKPPGRVRATWPGILAQAQVHPQAEVEELLFALALLAPDATGHLVASAESRPGRWVGAVHALQQAGYLILDQTAIARVLQDQYSPVVSARALQRGVRAHNEEHLSSYNRAQAWLQLRASR